MWHHQYEKRLSILNPAEIPWQIKKSNGHYSSPSNACVSGWAEIRSAVPGDWAVGAIAVFNNGLCQIQKNGQVVRILPIVPNILRWTYIAPGAVHLHRPDGSTLSYQYYGQSFSPMNGDTGQLQLMDKGKWKYTSKDGSIEEYSENGTLAVVTAANGYKQNLSYDPISNLLASVTDAVGGRLLFSYTDGKLTGVTTKDNKITSYSYNGLGLISDVWRPDGTHRQYHYEKPEFPTYLTGITDERGVRYATWDYDAQGRGILSEHANGADRVTISYPSDGTTILTNSLGKQTKYTFANLAGVRRVVNLSGEPSTNCARANKNYEYTPEGWLASKTDWKGIKTTYQYNAKGQEISRTEAEGTAAARIITTEWHPTLYVKTKVTEPDKETTYIYDSNGILTKQSVKSVKVQ